MTMFLPKNQAPLFRCLQAILVYCCCHHNNNLEIIWFTGVGSQTFLLADPFFLFKLMKCPCHFVSHCLEENLG